MGSVTPDNQWINDNFQEITYSLWIRSKDAFVEKAVITAKTSYEEVTGILRIAIDLTPGEIQQLQPPYLLPQTNKKEDPKHGSSFFSFLLSILMGIRQDQVLYLHQAGDIAAFVFI